MTEYNDYPELQEIKRFHSPDAEQKIIGSILIDSESLFKMDKLLPSSMYDQAHKMILEACLELSGAGKQIDVTVIAEYFDERSRLAEIGGLDYLLDIARNTVGSYNLNAYVKIVNDRAKERAILKASHDIRDVMNQPDLTTDDRVTETHKIVQLALGDDETQAESVGIQEVLKEYVEFLDWRYNNDEILGVMSGLSDVDVRLKGFQAGELYVIAGRPGSGKSTYATSIMLSAAKAGKKCYFASLEMPRKQLMQRMLAATADVTMNSLKDASALESHSSNITAAAFKMKSMSIEIDDNASTDISDLSNRVRTIKRRSGLDILIIDYLQLMKDKTIKNDLRIEISSITEKLKGMAKDLGIPVIVLAQVNRKCEDRNDKRPWNSDLAESGAIEANADVIQFVYRDEYYNEDTASKGIVEIITRKFRDGAVGTDYCNFVGANNQIKDLVNGYTPPPKEEYKPKKRGF